MFLRYLGVRNFVRKSQGLLQCACVERNIRPTRHFSITKRQRTSLSAHNLEHLQKNGTTFGQPTPFTHPHLLKPNELVAGISLDEFKMRRQHLMDLIRKHCDSMSRPKRNIVVVPASAKKYMSDKIPYVFRQDSNFFYLTGCLEPDSILVLMHEEDLKSFKSMLFMRPKNQHDELWDGARTGVEHSIDFFGVDEAHPLSSFQKFIELASSKSGSSTCWYDDKATDRSDVLREIVRGRGSDSSRLESPTEFLHEQRVIKSAAEVKLMRRTCEIASQAVNATMKESKVGDSEHHIFARVDYHCRMRDASFLAYPPVVAAGNNATTIHYITNTQVAKDGEMVLIDAGCEYGGYSSDITRTWPIGGHFTPVQEILYDVIFMVQQELLRAVADHSENITLDQLFDLMCFRLGKYLREVGLLDESLSDLQLARAAFKFCPHHVSHYLGMDIHDTPLITRDRTLAPGMVFTVEPGIYIGANNTDVPPEFRGIGIRIEDDVLMKYGGGIEVLTNSCIKEKTELKQLIAK